ncbi:Asp23/Gls24 family envelope stress response protein [Streptomyces longwoodensis]|uniref:Asp23/Gls24 family envelope stress response protein n=1 Tax=Streptomyces longwoodensis TaxID=68231 RepID=UPI0033E6855A
MSEGTVATGRRGSVVPAAERGATRIADRVVAKIASQAAREAVGALPPDAAPPHATVVVRPHAHPGGGGTAPSRAAYVRVHLDLDYPCDIGARCHAVRRHVAERVRTGTSMEVPEVAVQVEHLHLMATVGTARGRTR